MVAPSPLSTSVDAHANQPKKKPDKKSGGVRLFFYDREKAVAERAATSIAATYQSFSESFQYTPTRTFPYFLYSNYQEFLQTNVFPVQEGVLGVTAVKTLEMALPYFGDHQFFELISRHELAHQFTLQKVRSVAAKKKVNADIIKGFPLWFVEGLAEFYAHGGIDPQTRMLIGDMVLHPTPKNGFAMGEFFGSRRGYLWTYKLGQARCAFLEDAYGEGTLQGIINASWRLGARRKGRPGIQTFPKLVTKVVGDTPAQINEKFQTWVKQRAFKAFLEAPTRLGQLAPLPLPDLIADMHTSLDGTLLLYRDFERNTGLVRLRMVDYRTPHKRLTVVREGTSGIESLHPGSARNFSIARGSLAFVARHKARDRIYWQYFQHDAEPIVPGKTASSKAKNPTEKETDNDTAANEDDDRDEEPRWKTRLRLGVRDHYDVGNRGIVSVATVALAPDEERLAFVGIAQDGQSDIYVLEPREGNDYELTRATHDLYAERGLSWDGSCLVYASDRTAHKRFNIFKRCGDNFENVTRLTTEARNHIGPAVVSKGRVFVSAYDKLGANLYEIKNGNLVQRSRLAAGLFDVGRGPSDTIWALVRHEGRQVPVRIDPDMVSNDQSTTIEQRNSSENLWTMDRLKLEDTTRYSAAAIRSWSMDGAFGILGAGPGGVYGLAAVGASDRLRNHRLTLSLYIVGDIRNIDAQAFYTNSRDRLVWGAGLFQNISLRRDSSLSDMDISFSSGERFFGASSVARYPFSQFQYLQAQISAGGVQRTLLYNDEDLLTQLGGSPLVSLWEERNRGTSARVELSMSYGLNRLRYHIATGPIDGTSTLLEGRFAIDPKSGETITRVRLDADRYVAIGAASNILFRLGSGTTWSESGDRGFYLSSPFTLRSVRNNDSDRLLGSHYAYGIIELQVPFRGLLQLGALDIEGVLAIDSGGVGDSLSELWDHRVLNYVLGTNLGIGPLELRWHYARATDIGAPGLPNDGAWKTNLSLAYRYQ